MTAPLVFLDTETTGVDLDCDIWEVAAVKVLPDGRCEELHLFVEHDPAKAAALPERFRADLEARYDPGRAVDREHAAHAVHAFTSPKGAGKPHLVGVGVGFDAVRLERLLNNHGGLAPGWHHHTLDLTPFLLGWFHGRAGGPGAGAVLTDIVRDPVPYSSDALAAAAGVVAAPPGERHTAWGDVRWGMRIWQAVTGSLPPAAVGQYLNVEESA